MAKDIAFYFVKIMSFLITAVTIVLSLFFGIIVYSNFAKMEVPTLGPYKIYIVLSDSMKPVMYKNDAVIIAKIDPATLKVGDVITFFAFESNTIITHRITEVHDTGFGYAFSTKGDNNNTSDSFTTPGDRVIGKYKFRIPKFINFTDMTTARPYMIAVIVAAVVLVLFLLGLAERALRPLGEQKGITKINKRTMTENDKDDKEDDGKDFERKKSKGF